MPITGANAAVTAGDSTKYSTTGASVLQELVQCTPKRRTCAITAGANVMNPPLVQVQRTPQDLTMCLTTAHMKLSLQELVRRAPPLAHVL